MSFIPERSGPARYILGKMMDALGPNPDRVQAIEWLEDNALGMWQGGKDLPLYTVGMSLAMTAQLVIPGKETLERHPETANFGIHFRKEGEDMEEGEEWEEDEDFGEVADIPFHAPRELTTDGVIHSPRYEYGVGKIIEARMGDKLPYFQNLGFDGTTFRSRVVPGQDLWAMMPTQVREAERDPGYKSGRMTAEGAMEGLEAWKLIKGAYHALKPLNERGIAHRDGALRNFMLTPKGIQPIDFGGSAVSASERLNGRELEELRDNDARFLARSAANLQLHVTGRIDDPLAELMIHQAMEHLSPREAKRYQQIPDMPRDALPRIAVPDNFRWGVDEGEVTAPFEAMEQLQANRPSAGIEMSA
jgi:hypothetical protein